jgi:hypothetical protein
MARSSPGLGAAAALFLLVAAPAGAASPDTAVPVYGKVTVCYYSPECAFTTTPSGVTDFVTENHGDQDHPIAPDATTYPVVDAPAFEITNESRETLHSVKLIILANASLSVPEDSFYVGTLAPGKSVSIIPGLSNDGKTHTSAQFFYHSGAALDTSDSAPNADAITFKVTGTVGGQAVGTGHMVAGKSAGESNDKTVAHLNFLGGPGNADGPCDDCFGPLVIGHIKPQ